MYRYNSGVAKTTMIYASVNYVWELSLNNAVLLFHTIKRDRLPSKEKRRRCLSDEHVCHSRDQLQRLYTRVYNVCVLYMLSVSRATVRWILKQFEFFPHIQKRAETKCVFMFDERAYYNIRKRHDEIVRASGRATEGHK